MGWFDVAETPDGRSYSISTRPTGLTRPFRPSGASRVPLGWIDYLVPSTWIGLLLNVAVFHGSWTLMIAPWYGKRGKRWKVHLSSEAESDRRAEAMYQLIHSGQWDPENEPPPEPAQRGT